MEGKNVLASVTGNVPVIEEGEKGAKGATERPRSWDEIPDGSAIESGTGNEQWIDIVLYGDDWYQCIRSFTKGNGVVPTNTIYFKVITDYKRLATGLFLASKAYIHNLGVDNILITDQGEGKGNVLLRADKNGIDCKSGKFENIKVIGSMRNPFNLANDSFDTDYSDNVAMLSDDRDAWLTAYSMPWDVSQSGRRLTIVNYKWGSTLASGKASINAPSGKYFFEDGIKKSKLKVSREIVEMIGYGTTTEFYGWIVLNRSDLATTQKYGHCLKALAVGTVSGGDSNSNTSITSSTFDGSILTVSRQSEGLYRIYYPRTWFAYSSYCHVILTGRGVCYGEISPVKATMHSLGNGYFDVTTSDDATLNDGSFDFIIYNGSDFDILK